MGFPCGLDSKESACNVGDLGSIPGSGRTPGERNDNPFQYSCLENPMDGGVWWATVHGVTQSWTRLSDFTFFLYVNPWLFHFNVWQNPPQIKKKKEKKRKPFWGFPCSPVGLCAFTAGVVGSISGWELRSLTLYSAAKKTKKKPNPTSKQINKIRKQLFHYESENYGNFMKTWIMAPNHLFAITLLHDILSALSLFRL